MPQYSSWYINQLSKDRYGTDVPTLWNEVERLDWKLRQQSDELRRKNREMGEFRRGHEILKDRYRIVFDSYDRAVDALREERRRWRRVVY